MKNRPIIVHSLEDAKAAVAAAAELGLPVTLRSAPGAQAYLGAQVFRDVIAEAAAAHPATGVTAVFDCGKDPGLALGALRHGLKVVRLDASPETRGKIADIARQSGARLEQTDPTDPLALDLLEADDPPDAENQVRIWLSETD
jgi:fructose/tagatose bisphosphate aldolase